MVFLALETATTNCSVALYNDKTLIDVIEEDGSYSHAENLHVFIDQVIKKNNYSFSQLDAVAVGSGPGSYTGLRIGVSAAKGLCFALNIPLIAINTLDTMTKAAINYLTYNQLDNDAMYCPMLDARRMEVYTQITDNSLNVSLEITPMIVDENCALKEYSKDRKLYYFGSGAEKCEAVMKSFNKPELLKFSFNPASAQYMGDLATAKFEKKQFEDLAYYEPNYLKKFQATTPRKLL